MTGKATDEQSAKETGQEDDQTFELANVRRFIIGREPVSKFVANSRKMFLLKVGINNDKDVERQVLLF